MALSFDMTSCPDLAVPAQTMQRVAEVESGKNPFAIGVVGARLVRQPRNQGEAVATARMLEAEGYNFSVGIAQVNRSNLARYGLDSYEKAFDGCANLAAGARILAECFGRAGGDWSKAFSCYYSGDFVTGFREGYVQRITAGLADAAAPIVVYPQVLDRPFKGAMRGAPVAAADNASSLRITNRSTRKDAASISAPLIETTANPPDSPVSGTEPNASPALATPSPTASTTREAFIPRVSGPNDPVVTTAVLDPAVAGPAPPQEGRDAAFVF
jgi:type IV secretion system protein VirB1